MLMGHNCDALGPRAQGFFNAGQVVPFGLVALVVALGHDNHGLAILEASDMLARVFHAGGDAAGQAEPDEYNQEPSPPHRQFLQ
jgi:hypothetical protein